MNAKRNSSIEVLRGCFLTDSIVKEGCVQLECVRGKSSDLLIMQIY